MRRSGGLKDIPEFVLQVFIVFIRVLTPLQYLLLIISYHSYKLYFALVGTKKYERSLVIGVNETSRIIYSLGNVFDNACLCVLDGNSFYRDKYDYGPYSIILRPFIGPILLAKLAHLSEVFIYISFTGFLADRAYDFHFLKTKNKNIVTLFCGSDIRSLKKTKEHFEQIGEDSFVNYLKNVESEVYDSWVKKTASDADTYSDIILNWNSDQMSYLNRQTYPWPYVINTDDVKYNFTNPQSDDEVRIVHAASHYIVKGTPLIRASIKKLQIEGYKFHYFEANNLSNHELLEELQRSHIVLVQFYSEIPGLMGVESLASGNAVLMSPSCELNGELPHDGKDAWISTRYWEIYDKLKWLLDNPDQMEGYAERGRQFVERHYSYGKVREYYKRLFKEHSIPLPAMK